MTLAAKHPAARLSRPARLEGPARRIASLLPSATEIVSALGLEDRLVAVTHECDYPTDVVASLPRLTADRLPPESRGTARQIDAAVRTALADGHGLYALDDARLHELEPDLVLTQELCHVCAVAYPTVLEAARAGSGDGGPLVVSLEPTTLPDVLTTITLVAELSGVQHRGEGVVGSLRRRLEVVSQPNIPPRVALVEWLDPLFAPGHWVPDQVRAAGGDPIFGFPGERSREATWRELAAVGPEVVVLGLCGVDLARSVQEWQTFDAPDSLRSTPAWRARELWAIDGSAYVSRPGPRLVDGVEILAAIFRGDPDPRAVRLTAS